MRQRRILPSPGRPSGPDIVDASPEPTPTLAFHGGVLGALAPFALFLGGVAWLGLTGAPDETGFWPVLLAAIALGLFVARDRTAYADALVHLERELARHRVARKGKYRDVGGAAPKTNH